MRTKIFCLAFLAQILALILTAPIFFFASLSSWGDQFSGGTNSSTTFLLLATFLVAMIMLTVALGRLLLRRFAGCIQPFGRTIIIVGIIDVAAAFLPLISSGAGVLFVLFVYPLYTLADYNSSITKLQ